MKFIYCEHQWHYHSHLIKHLPFTTHFRSPLAKCCWCRMLGHTGHHIEVPSFLHFTNKIIKVYCQCPYFHHHSPF